MRDRDLRRAAAQTGVDPSWLGFGGVRHRVPIESLRAVMTALGVDPAAPRLPEAVPPVAVRRAGRAGWTPPAGASIELEDGTQAPPGTPPRALPLGYHRVQSDAGETTLIVAPQRCFMPDSLTAGGRGWGLAAQLYALRSSRSWGIGDLGDLAALIRGGPGGMAYVLLNPLHAADPLPEQEPSPYAASSRRFRNPLYLELEALPEHAQLAREAAADVAGLGAAARALNADPLIDRSAVFACKDAALRRCFAVLDAVPGRRAALAARLAADQELRRWGAYCAIVREHAGPWWRWPEPLRDPAGAAVTRYAEAHTEEVEYHAWLQLVLEEQLAALPPLPLGVICDLAVGASGGGFDGWSLQALTARGISVGAPPDELGPDGQNWGLPPFLPAALRRAAYAPLRSIIGAALQHAGGLRIDHVMGISRLFWIPDGAEPEAGAYVRYPASDLAAVIALESVRARALVVGEDLGIVEPALRRLLERNGILGYRLLRFDDRSARAFPRDVMAAATTHDLATSRGFFSGSDLEHAIAIGAIKPELVEPVRASTARQSASVRRRLVDEGLTAQGEDDPDALAVATSAWLARTPARLVSISLDDAAGAETRPNVPGTVDEHPNWRVPLPAPLDELLDSPLLARIAAALEGVR